MELTKKDIKITKGVAILFMLLLHLFGRKEVNGLYNTFPEINGIPLVYYIGLFGDACVPMFCFASGYGLFVSEENQRDFTIKKNFKRIIKLLINYWIVLVLFISIGFFAGNSEIFPGSFTKFLLNFFVLSNSYNGAWWFLQTYIILVLLSTYLFKLIRYYNSSILIMVSGIFYILSYIQRFKQILYFEDYNVLNNIVDIIELLGTSQLPFIIGALFVKEKIYSKLYAKVHKFALKNTFCIFSILSLIIFHSFFESLVIAPITGILFICFFNLIDKSRGLLKILDFIGNHSTNIWLTHMFFYLLIFPKITFFPKYPIFVFVWLVILCLISSFFINLIYKRILNRVNKKTSYHDYKMKNLAE